MSERCERCQAEGATQRYKGLGGFYCDLHHEANRVMCTSVDDGKAQLKKLSTPALHEIARLDDRKSVRISAVRETTRRLKAEKKEGK